MLCIYTTLWYFLPRGKFAFANRLSFQAQIEDLNLKCCMEGRKLKNKEESDTPGFEENVAFYTQEATEK